MVLISLIGNLNIAKVTREPPALGALGVRLRGCNRNATGGR